MRFSYFIIFSFFSFGISKSQDLKDTVRNLLKDNDLRNDIKQVILHLLKSDEILKRNIIEMVKEDLEKDFKEFSKRVMCKVPYVGEDCGQCDNGYFGEYPNCQKLQYVLLTGIPVQEDKTAQMEVMDDNGSKKICNNTKSIYPLKVEGTTGVFSDGKLIVCGGANHPTAFSVCYTYTDDQQGWKKLTDMNTPRYESSSIAIPGGILVTGGLSENGILKTSERIYMNGTVKHGKPLPEQRYAHCMVEYQGQVISTGGMGVDENDTSSVWFFNNHVEFNLTIKPSMQYKRYLHACGIVHSQLHEHRPLLVVAGGYDDYGTGSARTSEYLDFTVPGSQWQLCSEDLPIPMTLGPQMTNGLMSFLDRVYSFKCRSRNDCYWEEKNFKLKTRRELNVMIGVPSSLVENC